MLVIINGIGLADDTVVFDNVFDVLRVAVFFQISGRGKQFAFNVFDGKDSHVLFLRLAVGDAYVQVVVLQLQTVLKNDALYLDVGKAGEKGVYVVKHQVAADADVHSDLDREEILGVSAVFGIHLLQEFFHPGSVFGEFYAFGRQGAAVFRTDDELQAEFRFQVADVFVQGVYRGADGFRRFALAATFSEGGKHKQAFYVL